jgi:hypothetical protein
MSIELIAFQVKKNICQLGKIMIDIEYGFGINKKTATHDRCRACQNPTCKRIVPVEDRARPFALSAMACSPMVTSARHYGRPANSYRRESTMTDPIGYCATCAYLIEFIIGCPAGRCTRHGITIVRDGKTEAHPCWWYPAERTSCAAYLRSKNHE